jgi:hypothetical protein
MSEHGEFTCVACRETFARTRPEEEAKVEVRSRFAVDESEELVELCEDCYRVFMAKYRRYS